MAEVPPKVLFQAAIRDWPLRPVVKLCGWSLSTFMGNGGLAWPSMAAVAQGAGCHERTARRSLRELEALGLLEVRHSPGRAPNVYRVNPGPLGPGFNGADPGPAAPGSDDGQPGPWVHPTRALGAPNPGPAAPGEGLEGKEGVAGGRVEPGGDGQARGDEIGPGGPPTSAAEANAAYRRLQGLRP